jgi:hypothetical protein
MHIPEGTSGSGTTVLQSHVSRPDDLFTATHNILHRKPKKLFLAHRQQGMTMNMAVQAAHPAHPPASLQKKPVSPRKKQRPSMSLMPTTPRSSRLAISNLNNTNFGFSAKHALFQSFSELSYDDLFDKEDEEEEEQEPQKQDFMASLVDFLDDDDFFGDSELKKMCTERQASADDVTGDTEKEVDFNTNLASLFSYFNDLLTSKRAFDKKECSTLQQEMERLKKMRRLMTMATECKPDASGFLQSPPHSPTARSRKQLTLGRQHEGDAVQLQLEEQKRETESRGNPVTSPSRSSAFEYRGEPVTMRSRSPTPRSEGTHRSPKSPSRRGTSLMLSPRRASKQRDPLGASSYHTRSPRKKSGLAETSKTPSSRKGDSMSLGVSSNTSRSMSASISPRKSTRTSGQDYGLAAVLRTTSSIKADSMSKFGVSNHTSRSVPASMSPRKSTRTSSQDYPARSPRTPRKGDSMSLPCVSSHTNRLVPVSLSPRKSTRTSGQSDPVRSPSTPRRLRSRASSPVKSPRKFLQMDPLGASESIRLPITPRRLRSRASSPVKTIRLPWEFLQKDPLGVSESTPAPITPTKLRSGAYSPVKSPRLPRKYPRGVSESIRAVQLQGTPRRSAEKGSASLARAKSVQIPSSIHHKAKLNDRAGVPDSPKTYLSKSSQGGRPRAQRQATTTTLSNHDMFSNRETFICRLSL